jgi:hypothetical protein
LVDVGPGGRPVVDASRVALAAVTERV